MNIEVSSIYLIKYIIDTRSCYEIVWYMYSMFNLVLKLDKIRMTIGSKEVIMS